MSINHRILTSGNTHEDHRYFRHPRHSRNTKKPHAVFLTTLGIIIGVSSVVTLVNLGEGTNRAVQTQVATLGSNIDHQPGFGSNPGGGGAAPPRFEYEDLTAIRQQVVGVDLVIPMVQSTGTAVFNAANWSTGSPARIETISLHRNGAWPKDALSVPPKTSPQNWSTSLAKKSASNCSAMKTPSIKPCGYANISCVVIRSVSRTRPVRATRQSR